MSKKDKSKEPTKQIDWSEFARAGGIAVRDTYGREWFVDLQKKRKKRAGGRPKKVLDNQQRLAVV